MFEFNFKKLEVWKKSKELCLFVYDITKNLPKEELYCYKKFLQDKLEGVK